jgi:hypothetical protein
MDSTSITSDKRASFSGEKSDVLAGDLLPATETLRDVEGTKADHIYVDPEMERKVVRKIDFYILPFMCIVFLLQVNGIVRETIALHSI